MKKNITFKKSLLIYSLLVLLLVFIFLIYIFFTLKEYEKNQTGVFLKGSIISLSDNTLKGYLKDANLEETLLTDYKKLINSKDLEFKKRDDNKFSASVNNRELFTIETKVLKEKTKLGMFTYQEREIINIIPNLSRGLVYYDILIPSNYTLYIGDKKYEEKAISEEEYKDLSFMYYNGTMPKMNKYEINNLTKEETIKVEDFNGKVVDLKVDKYSYTVKDNVYSFDTYDDAASLLSSDVDIWNVAHTWSLFLSKDLSGASYGLNTVKTFLIEGTEMYNMANSWAHSIDITFTSKHTLKNPVWTNEKLNNFRVYGKDAFSCEVYLEKNMVVKGKDQQDVMHDTLYFIKNNGEWKLMNIKSVS